MLSVGNKVENLNNGVHGVVYEVVVLSVDPCHYSIKIVYSWPAMYKGKRDHFILSDPQTLLKVIEDDC